MEYIMIVRGDINDANYITKEVTIPNLLEWHIDLAKGLLGIQGVYGDGEYGRAENSELFEYLPDYIKEEVISDFIRLEGKDRYEKFGEDWKGEFISEYIPYYEYGGVHTIESVEILEVNKRIKITKD